jgi:hypothetical protein
MDGSAGLVTIEGATVFVNWSNVLYIEEISGDEPPLPQFAVPPAPS